MDNVFNRCLFSIPSKVEMAEEQEYLRVYVRVSNKYEYKIKKKVSGEIEGATSETRHTATQIWLKNLLVKKIITT